MKLRHWMWVLWPAFLLACMAELLVFAFVDPGELRWRGEAVGMSRQAVYTAAFFVFWMLAMGSSALTLLLTTPARALNSPED